jgi:hypothetical protein
MGSSLRAEEDCRAHQRDRSSSRGRLSPPVAVLFRRARARPPQDRSWCSAAEGPTAGPHIFISSFSRLECPCALVTSTIPTQRESRSRKHIRRPQRDLDVPFRLRIRIASRQSDRVNASVGVAVAMVRENRGGKIDRRSGRIHDQGAKLRRHRLRTLKLDTNAQCPRSMTVMSTTRYCGFIL